MLPKRDPTKPYRHDHLLGATVVKLVPAWMTPNMITVFRFAATPFVLWLLLAGHHGWGLVAFVLVAFTDALDGSVARLRKQITKWGTFYDPVADKLLIGSVVLLVVLPQLPTILAATIVGLEVCIMMGALFGRRRGRPISANTYGKTKMFLQVVGISLMLLAFIYPGVAPVALAFLWASVPFAVVSLFTYGL